MGCYVAPVVPERCSFLLHFEFYNTLLLPLLLVDDDDDDEKSSLKMEEKMVVEVVVVGFVDGKLVGERVEEEKWLSHLTEELVVLWERVVVVTFRHRYAVAAGAIEGG